MVHATFIRATSSYPWCSPMEALNSRSPVRSSVKLEVWYLWYSSLLVVVYRRIGATYRIPSSRWPGNDYKQRLTPGVWSTMLQSAKCGASRVPLPLTRVCRTTKSVYDGIYTRWNTHSNSEKLLNVNTAVTVTGCQCNSMPTLFDRKLVKKWGWKC
jgi:hypothetical protein